MRVITVEALGANDARVEDGRLLPRTHRTLLLRNAKTQAAAQSAGRNQWFVIVEPPICPS